MANLRTVSELKDSVAGLLSGVDINNVDDLNATLERAVSNVLNKADVPESSGVQNIMLYNGVYDYPIDPTIYGSALIDIAPQGVSRAFWQSTTKTGQQQFDRSTGYLPSGILAAFKYLNGVPVIRITSSQPIAQVVLDSMSETTGWTAGGSTGTIYQDTAVFYQQPASLRFNLTGSSAGTLTKTVTNGDLSSYQGVGVAFLAVYIPDSTTLTSIQLKIGSSASDYSSVTNTEGFLGAWTSNNWLLVDFDMSTANNTGTPDWSAIDYVQITINHTATQTNFRVGDLFICQPSANQIFYQSAAVFKAASGTSWSQNITLSTDTVIFNTPAYTIYLYECALAVLENMSGGMGD